MIRIGTLNKSSNFKMALKPAIHLRGTTEFSILLNPETAVAKPVGPCSPKCLPRAVAKPLVTT
jgi:hypothetical protein